MLKVRGTDVAFRQRALESIERSAQAQAVLINDLLDVSRVVSGKLKLESQPLDLQGVLLAAVDAVRPAVRARDIELDVSVTPIRDQVIGDADRLQQVIWNLLSNAVKFTPPGGRIEITMAQSGGAVQITVADTGGGIDPAFLPYVFERFRQADSSTTRVQGGLGLGLAIVRHLVELHGGTVTVESEGLGRGSLFVVTLPTREGPLPARSEPRTPADRLPSNVLHGVRVLAVDDDPDSRELLLVIMQDAGAEVMAVGSAGAALEALDSFNPQVAILDIAMPEVDGYDLMRQINARRDAPRAIAFSAYVGSDAVQRSKEVGFAMHLAKPTDYRRLVKAVSELAGAVESCR
jgi:CheY-like chemotaxis protein/anti-sigma regulatory factor (Ser/Thr protein kinase)